ncbi:hypothetical protein [Kibdelosporangium aridum]|uniref:Uncharacterized protein n=1 Tax=Kibdelosporangium aridum TaxID=2030 RepID=A0A1W2CJH1_KIBAR|nr:hypothetical protein [Kibdelosporangium aridum]SMC85387.1 hypothetical protein SAMN05661093_02192 [Kibdelosporangium aridum]
MTQHDTEPSGRTLVRQASKDEKNNLDAEFTTIRQLSKKEFQDFTQASRLLYRYTNAWTWDAVVKAANEFSTILNSAADTANKSSNTINGADIARANLAMKQIGRTAQEWANEFNEPEWQSFDAIQAQVSELTTPGSLPSILFSLADDQYSQVIDFQVAPRIFPVEFQVTLTSDVVSNNSLPSPTHSVTFIHDALDKLAKLARLELISMQEKLEHAGKLLWTLQAECVYGVAAIVKDTDVQNFRETGNISLTQLPLASINPVMNAVRAAKQFERLKGRPRNTTRPGPTATPQAEQQNNSESTEKKRPNASNSRAGNDRQQQPVAVEPIDIQMLLEEISRLPPEVERRWSQALANEMRADNEKLNNKFMSLAVALTDQLMVREQEMRSRDENITIRQFPIRTDDADVFNTNPTPDEHAYQFLVAQAAAMKLFTEQTRLLLQAPSNFSVNLPSGRQESWWSSGAFSTLNDLAQVVVNLFHVSLEPAKDSHRKPHEPHPWLFYVRLIDQSFHSGHVEAALVHAARAVALIARQNGVTGDIDAKDLTNAPFLQQFPHAVSALFEIVTQITKGGNVSIATAWCLAHFWRDALSELAAKSLPLPIFSSRQTDQDIQGVENDR